MVILSPNYGIVSLVESIVLDELENKAVINRYPAVCHAAKDLHINVCHDADKHIIQTGISIDHPVKAEVEIKLFHEKTMELIDVIDDLIATLHDKQ